MEFALMLNKIEKHLIAAHLVCAPNFQLGGYGQYGMHGSIVNVPTNLNLNKIYYHECHMMILPFFLFKEN
jgi:hypothetical protein